VRDDDVPVGGGKAPRVPRRRPGRVARERLQAKVDRLAPDGTADERAVRTYADATLGPPAFAPRASVPAADRTCRRVGVGLLPSDVGGTRRTPPSDP